MKVIIKRKSLLDAIRFTNNIIGHIIFYPVLQSIMIEAKDNKLTLVGSNSTNSSKFVISENINVLREGRILIKSRTVLSVISKLEGQEVLLEEVDNSLLKINANKFESNLNISNVEEYPNLKFEFEEWESIKINIEYLEEIIRKVSPSVNINLEKETIFNGILFDTESEKGFLKVIASDTFKMSYLRFPFNGNGFKMLIEPSTIKNILEFIKSKEVTFYKKENKIIISFDNVLISTKNIDGTYPNVEKIINQEYLYSFKINKSNLQNLLNRGHSLILNENKPIANFKVNKNEILISFKSMEIGFASESIEIESENLSKIEFSINISYLNSLLKCFENNDIDFYILEDIKPILMRDSKDEKFLQILVPLRKN